MNRSAELFARLGDTLSGLRGRITPNAEMDKITWFRAGGLADALFQPADEEDLAAFLKAVPQDVPITIVGIGSNLLVREGGISGFVVRLSAKGFGDAAVISPTRIRAGAATPDKRVAAAAQEAGIGGFHFYHGIPGGIGGALRMNAGANGVETRERVVEVRALDRKGEVHILSNADMGYAYRHSSAPKDLIFTSAVFEGFPEDRETIKAAMAAVQHHRETVQPIREKTGGSTFKNPEGTSAWKEIDKAGCRGLMIGGAQMSPMHCNFMINTGTATRLRPRISRRDGARPRADEFGHPPAMGNQAHRQFQAAPRGAGISGAALVASNARGAMKPFDGYGRPEVASCQREHRFGERRRRFLRQIVAGACDHPLFVRPREMASVVVERCRADRRRRLRLAARCSARRCRAPAPGGPRWRPRSGRRLCRRSDGGRNG